MQDFNKKLSISLNKKIYKKATMGALSDIKDETTLRENAAMVYDMATNLTKYKNIINQLKSAKGVINFVHNNEYGPLVETIMMIAFPPGHNEIFSTSSDNQGGYALSPQYFQTSYSTGVQGQVSDEAAASYRLQNILFGTPIRATSNYLKEQGIDEEAVNRILSDISDDIVEAIVASRNPGNASLSNIIVAYQRIIDEIQTKYDKEIEQINSDIESHFESIVGQKDQSLSDETITNMQNARNNLISLKNMELEQVDLVFNKKLNIANLSSGAVNREKNGFLYYSPSDVALKMMYELRNLVLRRDDKGRASPPSKEVLGSQIERLKTNLFHIRTQNPKLKNIIGKIITYLGDENNNNDLLKVQKNINKEYQNLLYVFDKLIKQQGRVMIIDDIDQSALCIPTPGNEDYRLTNSALSSFKNFMSINDKYAVSDLSYYQSKDMSKKAYPNNSRRLLIVVSANPVNNMPANDVINMRVAPVDAEEADIIVKHLLKAYVTEAEQIFYNNNKEQVNSSAYSKYLASVKNNPTLQASQSKIIASNAAQIVADQRLESLLAPSSFINRLKRMIVGLGQKNAIDLLTKLLSEGCIREEDEDGIPTQLSINHEYITSEGRKKVNELLQRSAVGLQSMRTEVKYAKYAFKRNSEWGRNVLGMNNTVQAIKIRAEEIRDFEKQVSELENGIRLSANTDESIIEALRKERERLLIKINGLKQAQKTDARTIPHSYILYGHPGTGKSIWAHALADLFDMDIKYVDFGSNLNKYLGESEKHFRALFNVMENSRDTIFLFDEIDRQVKMGQSSGTSGDAQHSVTAKLIEQLLQFFDGGADRDERFKENNLFFILTTNYLPRIDPILKKRIPDQFEVELPDDPKDYKMFFDSFMEVERERFPNDPIVAVGDLTTEESLEKSWEKTFELLNTLDWNKISYYFAKVKKMDFRALKQILTKIFNSHIQYETVKYLLNNGYDLQSIPVLRGMPLTTDNIMRVAQYAKKGEYEEMSEEFDVGVNAYEKDLWSEAGAVLEKYKKTGLPKEEYKEEILDPLTGRKRVVIKTRTIIPDDVEKILRGSKIPEEELEEKVEYVEEIDPQTGEKSMKIKKTPQEEMDLIKDRAFEEKPIETKEQPLETEIIDKVEQEVGPVEQVSLQNKMKDKTPEIKKNERKKEKVSSTDYFFRFLQNKGVISSNGNFIIKEGQNKDKQKYRKGCYNFGNLFIGTAYVGAPAQEIPYIDPDDPDKNILS